MSSPNPLNDPDHPLGAQTWLRGMWLGFGLLLLFALGAGLAYLLAGLLGWQGVPRGMVALFVGPVLGTLVFFALRGFTRR